MYRDTIAKHANAGAHRATMVRQHRLAGPFGHGRCDIGFVDIFMPTGWVNRDDMEAEGYGAYLGEVEDI